ncbi:MULTISPECIES: YCF48-related protein [unclassified Pseudomonas]|uniref:WD40/YVTN/BNR-like repeat-containing protein n=1 Tax=unclassified Pseudomonas TaxID=196821 RepID=UPI003132F2F2
MSLIQRNLVLVAGLLLSVACAAAAQFRDPLDIPARPSTLAQHSMLTAIAQTPGGRWVAVGRRGHALYSDDGTTWHQAEVPVSVDLVAVHFPTPDQGWAVGHGGVILHSADGGKTWLKQLDGRALADLLIAYWKPLAAKADESDAGPSLALLDAERFKVEGPGRPFLDVRFKDALSGYAVGAYNLLLATENGGQSWQVLSDKTDNPGGLHFNAVRLGEAGQVYLAGEQGLLLQKNLQTGRFDSLSTPYSGTWFGMLEQGSRLLLFGLRGNVYVSHDQGQHWRKANTGTDNTITAATSLKDMQVVLVTQAGEVLMSEDSAAERFRPIVNPRAMPLYGVAPAGKAAVIAVGAGGVVNLELGRQ